MAILLMTILVRAYLPVGRSSLRLKRSLSISSIILYLVNKVKRRQQHTPALTTGAYFTLGKNRPVLDI